MEWRSLLGEVLQAAGPIADQMAMQTMTAKDAWNHPDIQDLRQRLLSVLTEKHNITELIKAGQELRRQHQALLSKKDLSIVELSQLGVLSGTAYVLTADALAQASTPSAIFQYTMNEVLPWLRKAANVALIVANVATGGAAGQLLNNLHFGISSMKEAPMPTHPQQLTPYGQMLCKLIDTTHTLAHLMQHEARVINAAPTPAAHGHGVRTLPAAQSDDSEDPPIQATDYSLHVGEGEVREQESIILSFDPLSPGKLGAEIVRVAQEELARPVKEEYTNGGPSNFDKGGHIKKYFVEGPRWKAETWESYKEKHGGNGPAWCAAFVSFCWRTAHRALGVELPLSLNAQCSELFARAEKAGRFIPRDGQPSPGDIVFLGSGPSPGHVGLVEKKDADGIIHIIEGNAGEKTDQLCRSRLIPGKPRYAKLIGFAAVDAPEPAQQQPTQSQT